MTHSIHETVPSEVPFAAIRAVHYKFYHVCLMFSVFQAVITSEVWTKSDTVCKDMPGTTSEWSMSNPSLMAHVRKMKGRVFGKHGPDFLLATAEEPKSRGNRPCQTKDTDLRFVCSQPSIIVWPLNIHSQ